MTLHWRVYKVLSRIFYTKNTQINAWIKTRHNTTVFRTKYNLHPKAAAIYYLPPSKKLKYKK